MGWREFLCFNQHRGCISQPGFRNLRRSSATYPGAFALSEEGPFSGTDIWVLSSLGSNMLVTQVFGAVLGLPMGAGTVCSTGPVRSAMIAFDNDIKITIVYEDGTICVNGFVALAHPSPRLPYRSKPGGRQRIRSGSNPRGIGARSTLALRFSNGYSSALM